MDLPDVGANSFAIFKIAPKNRSNFQPIDRFSINQVRFDDFIHISLINIGIPGTFRINHAHRPFLTPVQAARLVDAYPAFTGQAQFPDLFLGVIPNLRRTTLVAVRAVRVRAAIVDAKEDMSLVVTQNGVRVLFSGCVK